jgi:Na+/H+ antiporter NhaA
VVVADADAEMPGRTPWTRALRTPLRVFVDSETGGALALALSTVAAVVWANIDIGSYERVWGTHLSIRLNTGGVSLTLRDWINSGLMTFFFFVVGLEARREIDLGELREARRVVLPLLAGAAGMLAAGGLFLAINAGTPSARGWGAVISTDTAFALGVLAIVGPAIVDRLRAFVVTVLVVDDIVALIVIAGVYTKSLSFRPLLVAVGLLGVLLAIRAAGVRSGILYAMVGIAMWVAMVHSGVDPLVVGLILGLLTYAFPAAREDLEHSTEQFRLFREQPTPELARRARASLEAAISPNERLAATWHPWTSFVIVPLFGLSNAGVPLNPSFLGHAFTSRLTLGVLFAYVVGKPLGIGLAIWLITMATQGRLRAPVGWGSVLAGGSAAGTAFTLSLLIATLAFPRSRLAEAKVGVLATLILAPGLSWLVFRGIDRMPPAKRVRALLGTSAAILDLVEPVDPKRDHIRGPIEGSVTVVEYGDFECPFCGRAESAVRELLRDFAGVVYVWRHLPLDDVHPHARIAAEASEAASAQGRFWEMHDLLLRSQNSLRYADLVRYAEELGLDVARFVSDLKRRVYARRVAEDVESADLSGVSGTPTFFVNGRRHHGAYDLATLSTAVKAAGARTLVQ